MPKKVRKKKPAITAILLLTLVVTVLAFIWGNSLQSIPDSQARSLGIVKLLTPFLEPIFGNGNVTDHFIRKLAHFIEFGVLGSLLASYAIARNTLQFQSAIDCTFFSLVVAVIDESIQIFSNRGSQVQDVLLDFWGAVVGLVLVLLIRSILWRLRSSKWISG